LQSLQPVTTRFIDTDAERAKVSLSGRYIAVPDEGTLLKGANLTIVDLATGAKKTLFPRHVTEIKPICFSADEKFIFVELSFFPWAPRQEFLIEKLGPLERS